MTTSAPRATDATLSPAFSLLAVMLIAAILRVPMTSVGPLLAHIRESTGLGAAGAGFLNTLPLLALAGGALISPALGRRLGLERAMFHAALLLTVGVVLRSLPGVGSLFAGTLLIGIAIAIGNVLLPAFIKREYPERSGQVTGLFVVVMALTAGIAAGLAVPLAEVLPGNWRSSLACALALTVPAAAVWFVRTRHAKEPATLATVTPHANVWGSWLAWQVTLLNGFQAASFYALAAWVPSMMSEMSGASAAAGGWLLSLMQILALTGSTSVSFILGRVRDQRAPGLAASLLCMAGFIGLALYPAWAVVWIGVIGFGLGCCLMLSLAFISLRASSTAQAASLSGMSQSLGYLVAAAGPLMCGIWRSHVSSWLPILGGLAALSVAQGWMAWGAGRNAHIGQRPGH